MSFAAGGAFPPSLLPSAKKQALGTNYLSFNGGSGDGDSNSFAQQYLPELYEAEIERYGNRTLQGFLRMVGAEMPMSSDQVIWTEQNRLHISYDGCTNNGAGTILTVPIVGDTKECVIRKGATVVISNGINTVKARVSDVSAATGSGASRIANVTYKTYKVNDGTSLGNTAGALKIFVYGSEFAKGSVGMELGGDGTAATSGVTAIQPDFTQFSNKPIIIKDYYEVSGSDTAQIGWVEVATEAGQSGFLWYLKAESETRLRFEDYLEMSMVEAEKKGSSTSGIAVDGSEGLFAAIEERGNVYNDFAGAAAPGAGALGDFDTILKQLDTQGAIEENMLFLSRQTALDFDDMIAAMNGAYASTGAVSYGLFNNEEDMALNFGFSGFRRGSYDFYKTDWKYLNDFATRGNIGDIDGVLIPAGTSTVYDQLLGSNIRRPFLHVRYRASEADDRRMKSWVVGSVGAATTGLDAMQIHFLSERLLCVQGANNFVLFKSTV
jgi:hypothetical protein